MGMTKTEHAANTAPNAYIEAIRASGSKTVKAACGRRIASDKIVADSETTCDGCKRQIAADTAAGKR